MGHKIHWLGAGLSSAPGIKRLVLEGYDLWLWNRSLEAALTILAEINASERAKQLDWQELANSIGQGDVLVSMLPGAFHLRVAQLSIDHGAHFVSSSYITPEMHGLHSRAQEVGVCLVNEVGLDPGIDHLMTHALLAQYRQSPAYAVSNKIIYKSYCGGLPAQMNDFTYKFSWSPLGVLKALKSKAQWLEGGEVCTSEQPWHSVSEYQFNLDGGQGQVETFEAYPNRDSLPFMQQYHFDPQWQVDTFVRGTLRSEGWSEAWQDIFNLIDSLTGMSETDIESILTKKSTELWQKYAYQPDEQDRVVLCVELAAHDQAQNTPIWHQSYSLNAFGNDQGTAMARLVSQTVSLSVISVLQGEIAAGVSATPDDIKLVSRWMDFLCQEGEALLLQNHLVTL